jgi:hypothetical protein
MPVLEGLPTDWTHRHLIFSQPMTVENVAQAAQDPRYWQQWYRQNVARVLTPEIEAPAASAWLGIRRWPRAKAYGYWEEDLGTGASVGAGNFPAKYSFGVTTANCGSATSPDFVVFSTGLVGSTTQASIAAYDNLYSGCTGTVPSVYWAYYTDGQIRTSPVFSRNGSQLAFVQTTTGAASLVLLKWAASTIETVGAPGTPTSVVPASYSGCTAPCKTTIALTSGTGAATNDTTSSVFYDYGTDTAWVGDGSGWLHQFTPVFNGTPAEIRTSPWPVQVNTTTPTALTSPVHDHVSGYVFVGDQGGYLYRVSAASGAVTASGRLDYRTGGLAAGPVVDATTEKVYVFASSDGTTGCTGGAACSAVYQFATNFGSGTTGSKVTVGTSSAAPNPMYDGAFDSAYFSSRTATGNLYVCGDTGVNPILYQVPISAGTLGTVATVASLTGAANHRTCSPVTDIPNPNTAGATERVIFSTTRNARPTICAGGGCAMSFVTAPWQPSTRYSVGQEILVNQASTLYVNVAIAAGTSAATPPTWLTTLGAVTSDGTVSWLNQGTTTLTPLANWTANHVYTIPTLIVDSKGNVEVVSVAGTSGGTAPTWATTAGATTTDNTVTWTNAGVLPSAALPATGGTSGIIMDNTVGSGTLAGASQVYFSTLGNQACATSGGTGGCAVQASQSALQ